ncbi:MAG: oligosaccharide flippase family protein [Eubacterium coprostanoligenes]|uniref:lipopolysaccharide biosynthesis protein n=1 Tax=Eubacterium coprostanoligenes TaxID=290054 RepID=UPI0023547658|nr:oligosaccharide flippase family protein [Eubacterium coprostanoligenes]MCI7264082.1 oligosaccharide flippase family protein [Eubacterium coprostanoligenes]
MNKLKNLFNKYKTSPIQVRASFWFLICGILQNGLSVITLPIFTRLLSTEQYGLSSTYFAWYDLIVVICTLRLSYGAFDKGMIKYENDRDKFESAILGLTTTISVCVLIIFLIFHKTIEKLLGMSFILCFSLFACQIFAPALLFWTARNKYEYKYKKFTIVTLLTSVICTFSNLIAVLFIHYDRGITKILSYQVIWCCVYLFFYIYIFCKGKTFFKKDVWKYALKFNLPLIPYFLSTLVLDKADRMMIGNFCGNSYVALYSVSYNLGRLMVLFTAAIDATVTPWIYSKLKSGEFKSSKKISFFIIVLFMLLATMFMLFAPELIYLLAAPEYKEAVYIIPPVITSYFFVMLYEIISKIEFYYEKTKTVAIITVLAAVLDIILNYIFIPKYGYLAAGYTTLASYVFMAIGHFIASKKIAKEKQIYDKIYPWKAFFILSCIIILITIAVNIIYSYSTIRIIILMLLVFILLLNYKKVISIFKKIKK